MVKLHDICKYKGDRLILNHISLSLEHHSVLGLAGPSGGGKSTLLRCLQGLESVDAGYIQRNGQAGFMFQDFQLFPHMTVLENILYAPRVKLPLQDHKAPALIMLEKLGIYDKASKYPHQLSGGQKQRVALCRTLMMSPELLLCDEPTSGLDIASMLDVVDILKSIKSHDMIMVIASHDLDFLTKIADRIVILKNGKISIDTPTSELKNPAEYLKNFYYD